MTLQERLEFCSICTNRKVDLKIGLICKLSEEKPDFNGSCDRFVKDEQEAERLLNQKLKAAGNNQTQDGSLKPKRNKQYGLAILILGIITFIFSMIIGGIMIFTGISFIVKGFRQDKILREHQVLQQKIEK